MTAADPRQLARVIDGPREEAERQAREIALAELQRNYNVDRDEAVRMLDGALAAPAAKRPLRCRLGRHRYGSGVTIAEAGAGVVLSEHHGPIETPAFRIVGKTCVRCPTVRFDVEPAS